MHYVNMVLAKNYFIYRIDRYYTVDVGRAQNLGVETNYEV